MARYASSYEGEKRTEKLTVQLTPSERAALERGKERAGAASLSQHARDLCLRRSGDAPVVAGTMRNAAVRELVNELAAIGNNLNQLARVANTNNSAPQLDELRDTTKEIKAAIARVIRG